MYEDKTLTCKECGAEFVFTAGEQEFYAEKGFIQQFRVPADGTFTSSTVDDTWRINPDLEKNQQLLHDFIYLDQQPESAEKTTAE